MLRQVPRSLSYLGSMLVGGASGLALGKLVVDGEDNSFSLQRHVTSAKVVEAEQKTSATHGGMDKSKWTSFTLGERQQVTPNTHLFRFKLEDKQESLNLPIASCLLVR